MQKVKLGDIAQITAGQGAPQGEDKFGNEGLPFVRAGNLADLLNGKNESDLPKIDFSVAKKFRMKEYPQGSILFAKSGMSCMKGYVYVLKSPCYVVSHLAVVIPKTYNSSYLKYYFNFYRPNSLIKDSAYPSIALSDIANIEIQNISLSEQKAIAEKLDKVSILIEKRKQQLSLLDTLVKSKFVDMFGMIGKDEKGWGIVSLGDVCCFNPKKSENLLSKNELEVSFVPMTAVSEKGELDVTDIKSYEQVQKGFTYFVENDVLFAKITPCMENGKGAVACGLKNGIGFGSTEFHVMRPKNGICNPTWLYIVTSFKEFRQEAARNMTGSAGQRRVPVSFLSNYKISLPPFDLQNQFADFVEKAKKTKTKIKQSLAALELLKKSLMQKYFGSVD